MIDEFFRTLQNSAFSTWVQETAYPYVITAHSVGLATLVGLLTLIDLRVLGFVKTLPLPALRKLMPVVWIGFWVNAISGLMLFSIDAHKDFYSNLFRVKISSIALGLILGTYIKKGALLEGTSQDPHGAVASVRVRALAGASLLTWIGAIVCGRLMAYFTYGDIGIE
jgi:hypothetical protein